MSRDDDRVQAQADACFRARSLVRVKISVAAQFALVLRCHWQNTFVSDLVRIMQLLLVVSQDHLEKLFFKTDCGSADDTGKLRVLH